MKKIKVLLAIMALALVMSGCSPSAVDAGEEGVMVKKPWVFGHGGVDETPLTTGLAWTAWSTEVHRMNIKPMRADEAFVDITSSDNVPIDFSSYLTLQITEGATPKLYEAKGEDWYRVNVQDYYRTLVRNEARTRTSLELRKDAAVIKEVQASVHESLSEYLAKNGLPVSVIKVVIGKVVPPKGVLEEAERTASQKQRKATEEARAKTEGFRAKAEKNKALADLAYAKEFRMTTEQFLKNKRLDIMQLAIERKETPVSLIMNASNASPIFSAK